MQETYLRNSTMILSISFILLGVAVFFFPATALLTFTVALGIMMLINGVITTITYFLDKNEIKQSGWVLTDGIASLLLGIIILINAFIGVVAVIFLIAVWLIFSGVLRISGSLQLKEWGIRRWGLHLTLGILNILVGGVTLFSSLIGGLELFFFLALSFIILGINGISMYMLFRQFDIRRTGKNNEQIEIVEK